MEKKKSKSGIVKQVADANTIIISFKNVHSKFQKIQIDDVVSPRGEEIFGFQAREFVRRLLVGMKVNFTIKEKIETKNKNERVHTGNIWVGRTIASERNLSFILLKRGYARISKNQVVPRSYVLAEKEARELKIGIWSKKKPEIPKMHIVNNKMEVEEFFKTWENEPTRVVVEVVISCSLFVVRLETGQKLQVFLSGVRQENEIDEYSHHYVETRILQRDMYIIPHFVKNSKIYASLIRINDREGEYETYFLQEELIAGGWVVFDEDLESPPFLRQRLKNAQIFACFNKRRRWEDYEYTASKVNKWELAKSIEVVSGVDFMASMRDGSKQKIKITGIIVKKSKDKRPLIYFVKTGTIVLLRIRAESNEKEEKFLSCDVFLRDGRDVGYELVKRGTHMAMNNGILKCHDLTRPSFFSRLFLRKEKSKFDKFKVETKKGDLFINGQRSFVVKVVEIKDDECVIHTRAILPLIREIHRKWKKKVPFPEGEFPKKGAWFLFEYCKRPTRGIMKINDNEKKIFLPEYCRKIELTEDMKFYKYEISSCESKYAKRVKVGNENAKFIIKSLKKNPDQLFKVWFFLKRENVIHARITLAYE